jgi:hypothetical protein
MLFYYPNRPILVPPDPDQPLKPRPDYINSLEASGRFVAEKKWNGDNVCIHTSGLEFYNRRGQRHRYVPTPEVRDELEKFPKQAIVNAELVHYKTKKIKNTIICHSVLAWNGRPLSGKTWGDARDILEDQEFGNQVQLSPVWKSGFWQLFKDADGEVIEGIILKDPTGKLVISATKIPDVSYMLKIRKPSKKYPF